MKLLNRILTWKTEAKSQFELGYYPPEEPWGNCPPAEMKPPTSMNTWEYAKDICSELFKGRPHLQSLMGRVFLFLDPKDIQEFDRILQNHLKYFEEETQNSGSPDSPFNPMKLSHFMEKWNKEHDKSVYSFYYIQRQNSPDLWEMFGAEKSNIKTGNVNINYYQHFHNYPRFINRISGDKDGVNFLNFVNIGHGTDTQKYARELAKFILRFSNEMIADVEAKSTLQKNLNMGQLSSFEYVFNQIKYSFFVDKKKLYLPEPAMPHIMFQMCKI